LAAAVVVVVLALGGGRGWAAPKIGDACSKSASCGGAAAHLGCYDRTCECQPGFVACGATCVDVTVSTQHCGACNISCAAGGHCESGVCIPKSVPGGNQVQTAPPLMSKATKPFPVTPASCSCANCTKTCGAYESHPVLSATTGMLFQASPAEGGGQLVTHAAATDPTQWTCSGRVRAAAKQVETVPGIAFEPPLCFPGDKSNGCLMAPNGDVWAASSGWSGLEFVAARATWHYQQTAKAALRATSAPAMLAFSGTALQSVDALPPAAWATPVGVADDGLTIATDPGGPELWLAANGCVGAPNCPATGEVTHPKLFLFPSCKGDVGGSKCALKKFANGQPVVDVMANEEKRNDFGHTTVIVNPCTHHALVSFGRSADQTEVTVAAIDHAGTTVATWSHSIPKHNDTQCPDAAGLVNCTARPLCPDPAVKNTNCCPKGCDPAKDPSCSPACPKGEGSQVSRVVPRAQMDVKVTRSNSGAASCTLYVGFDTPSDKDPVRRAATLASIDVTPDASGREDAHRPFTVVTQVDRKLGESMDATPVASRFGDAVALVYVQRDPCGQTETLFARVSRSPTFVSYTDVAVSDPSPNTWFGDSLSELLGGVPGGQILATWPQPSTTGCASIFGSFISVGTVMVPPKSPPLMTCGPMPKTMRRPELEGPLPETDD
jgi:hypothetical protein